MENQQNIDSVVNNKDIVINNFKEEDKYDCFKNQKILSNKGFMIIILDCFNDEFIYYEHKEVKRKKFINIIYKSPTIFLNGLTFETPWMKTVKDCYSIYNNNTKYWLEQTFIDYQDDSEINLFLQIMNNIDKNVINYLDSYKSKWIIDEYGSDITVRSYEQFVAYIKLKHPLVKTKNLTSSIFRFFQRFKIL